MKKILVTGGSGDIGEAICRDLASSGAHVVLQYHQAQKRAQAIAKEIKGHALQADLASEVEIKKMIQQASKHLGGLEALINVAGFPINKKTRSYWDLPFEKISRKMFEDVLAIDALGTISCIQAVLPIFKKQKFGKIINFASSSALLGHNQGYPFNVAKAGLINLTKSLAPELGPYGITINAIAPCSIRTRWLDHYPKNVETQLKKKIPLGRLGTPEDVAQLVSFLISTGGDWLTGQIYLMDGGETL